MGKKNHTPADRERIKQAAAERRHEKEVKQLIALILLTVAVIAVIGVFNLVRNAVTTPAEIKDLSAIQEDWIVVDVDNKVSKRYHHPASFTIPEGYVRVDHQTFNDGVQQDFLINAESEDAVVSSVNVFAAADWSAKQYIQRVYDMQSSALNEGSTVQAGEPFSATVAGKKAECIYLRYTAMVEGEEKAYGCLFVGFDAPRNVCVYSVLSGAYTTPENAQTVETLLAEAETLLAGLTIVK